MTALTFNEKRALVGTRPHLSIVTPAYKCEHCIPELYSRLTKNLSSITDNYEIIFVEDGSPFGDWKEISRLCETNPRVKGIKLSKNYGQHYAITAGLDHAFGDWVVVMDCDLQDRPEEIINLYHRAIKGSDIVIARRKNRDDSLYRRISSRLFCALYSYLGDIEVDPAIANFSISSQKVISEVRKFRERNRSFPIFLSAVGFSRSYLDVVHSKRFEGKSSYHFSKLFDLAIQSIVSQSNKPLRLSIRFGFLLTLFSLIYVLNNFIIDSACIVSSTIDQVTI
jgi:dolichol-phosphate mannosyltransferase